MKNWFNIKLITDPGQRTLGIMLRLFGVDFTAMLLGWVNDWKLIDLRIPVNNGIYLQALFVLLGVGRLPTGTYEEHLYD